LKVSILNINLWFIEDTLIIWTSTGNTIYRAFYWNYFIKNFT